jgi:succinate dehydrogenase / fumarate reductase cytochrome b subunit
MIITKEAVAEKRKAQGRGSILQSPIGKKLLTGITGLGLATFVLIHMLGNLVLFFSANAYNQYGYFIEKLGPVTWTIELGLLAFVLVHATVGVQIFLNKLRSRPVGYAKYASAGSPSQQSLSSRSMIWTGLVLSVFLIWHLSTVKFGVRYLVAGTEVRDLARLVFEQFRQPLYTTLYTAVMVLLGFHLRHGIWSALQSLGLMERRVQFTLYTVGTVLAVMIALGFLVLPLAIYFGVVTEG